MSDSMMAAAQGMLLLSSGADNDKNKGMLTIQVPCFHITKPIKPPFSTKGKSQQSSSNTPNANGKRRNSDAEDAANKPVKKRAVTEPLDSRTHFNKTHVELKPLGSGDNGEAYAAIEKVVLADIAAKHNNDNTPAFFNDVRAAMIAVKYPKPNKKEGDLNDDVAYNMEGDLTNEIAFLKEKFPYAHPLLNYRLDSHIEGDCQWLTMPYAQGGDLISFSQRAGKDLTLSLRWHIMSQLVEALMFLFFGVSDIDNIPDEVPEWLMVVHGDIFAGNTLLGPVAADGYPSCIAADFGRADSMAYMFPDVTDRDLKITRMRVRQANDLHHLGEMLVDMTESYLYELYPCDAKRVTKIDEDGNLVVLATCSFDNCCAKVIDGIEDPTGPEAIFMDVVERLKAFGSTKADFSDAYEFMREILKTAKEQKAMHYRPLSSEAWNRLTTPYVTDDDIKKALGIFDYFRVSIRPMKELPMRLRSGCEV